MLIGKAKSDFIEYHYNQVDFTKESHEENYEMFLHQTEVTHQLASIIEWLDSVGLYIYLRRDNVAQQGFNWSIESKKYGFHNLCNHAFYFDRNQATEHAIIKANEIYNSQ